MAHARRFYEVMSSPLSTLVLPRHDFHLLIDYFKISAGTAYCRPRYHAAEFSVQFYAYFSFAADADFIQITLQSRLSFSYQICAPPFLHA